MHARAERLADHFVLARLSNRLNWVARRVMRAA